MLGSASRSVEFQLPEVCSFQVRCAVAKRMQCSVATRATIAAAAREGQPPGTSAGSTSPIRRQPFDSSQVRGAATSGMRSASA